MSTFDPVTAEPVRHRVYDAWPPDVAIAGASIFSVAASPDGSFAAAIGYGDDGSPDGFAVRLVFGHLEEEGVLQEWVPPWSILTWHPFHAGFDRDAFVFAFLGAPPAVLVLRLAPDGSELMPPTEVGGIATIYDDSSSFRTDAATGITWLACDMLDGVWLSGHQRDGSPIPWTGPDEWLLVEGQGVPPTTPAAENTAIALDGERALVAWGTNSLSTTYLQVVDQGVETGEALVLFDNLQGTGPYLGGKLLERLDEGWWLGGGVAGHDLPVAEMGVNSFWFGSDPAGGIDLTGRSVLVGWPPCLPDCELGSGGLRFPASLRYQDELWYGFEDRTNTTPIYSAYRIVRVGRSCRYATLFELYHPELMPADAKR